MSLVWMFYITSKCLECLVSKLRLTINAMDQSPSWEGDRCRDSQETIHLLQKSVVHYHVHKSLPLDLVIS